MTPMASRAIAEIPPAVAVSGIAVLVEEHPVFHVERVQLALHVRRVEADAQLVTEEISQLRGSDVPVADLQQLEVPGGGHRITHHLERIDPEAPAHRLQVDAPAGVHPQDE